MAMTQKEIDALIADVAGLNRAIADGVRQVTLGGQTVTYNTTDSLIKARDDAQDRLRSARRELAAQTGDLTVRRSRITVLYQLNGRGY